MWRGALCVGRYGWMMVARVAVLSIQMLCGAA